MGSIKVENEKEVEVLNSLIEYNNDRVEGYQKAIEETDHTDLKLLFAKYSVQSTLFVQELNTRVSNLGGVPSQGTTNSGKVYRAWMDMKAALTGKDRKAILNTCEFGEDAALSAYKNVLKGDDISIDTRKMVEDQVLLLRGAHDEIKALRDIATS
jgi:uncharacterized protein (TIGR02284 family)